MNVRLQFIILLLNFKIIFLIKNKILIMIINLKFLLTILRFLINIFIYSSFTWRIWNFVTIFLTLWCKLHSLNIYFLNSFQIVLLLQLVIIYFLRVFLHIEFPLLFRFLRFEYLRDFEKLLIIFDGFWNDRCCEILVIIDRYMIIWH